MTNTMHILAKETELDLNQAIAIASGYKNYAADYVRVHGELVQWLVDNKATNVFFDNNGGPVEMINTKGTATWNAAPAIYAASDVLLYDMYGEGSAKGFHLHAWADLRLRELDNYALVGVDFPRAGTDIPEHESHHLPWMVVNRRAGRNYLSFPKQDNQVDTVRKHDYIDYLVEGCSLNVNFAAIRSLAATVFLQFLVGDIALALEIKENRMEAKRTMDAVRVANPNTPAQHPLAGNNNGAGVGPAPTAPITVGTLKIKIAGSKKSVDMFTKPAGSYFLYNGNNPLYDMRWDPANAYAVKAWENAAEEGFSVEA